MFDGSAIRANMRNRLTIRRAQGFKPPESSGTSLIRDMAEGIYFKLLFYASGSKDFSGNGEVFKLL